MQLSQKVAAAGLVLTLFVAAILDRFLFAPFVPGIANLILVEPNAIVFGVPVAKNLRLGVIPVVFMALLVGCIIAIPFRRLGDPVSWRAATSRWWRMSLLTIALPVLLLIGGFGYKMIKGSCPGWASTLLEGFGFQPIFYTYDDKHHLLGPLDGSLACLVGLLVVFWFLTRVHIRRHSES